MIDNFDIVFPPAAQRAQAERGSAAARQEAEGFPDRVTPELAAFAALIHQLVRRPERRRRRVERRRDHRQVPGGFRREPPIRLGNVASGRHRRNACYLSSHTSCKRAKL